MPVSIDDSADVAESAVIGDGSTIWHLAQVRHETMIGARAECVAQLTIGRWAVVAAGATVVRDVPGFALVLGVPAPRVGWVGRTGFPLQTSEDPKVWRRPTIKSTYREVTVDVLEELS